MSATNGWTSHGHAILGVPQTSPRPPSVARCGGPAMCGKCGAEASLAQAQALDTLAVGSINTAFYRSPHPTPDLDPLPALLKVLNGAKATITFATYSFTHPQIAAALIAAKARGVTVQGVADTSEWAGVTSQYKNLLAAGIDLREWGGPFRLMHEKACVVDQMICTAGSFNWTTQGETENTEVMFVFTGVQVSRLLAPAMLEGIQQAYAVGKAPA